ncbi:MAG: hypothetical protein RL033_243 [Pseudomonadota bacterium]|jgi:hypothetical protein
MRSSFTRRQFAQLLAGAFSSLPLLEALPARAQDGAAAPKRLVLLFNPNGNVPEAFWPTAGASESEFTLGPILQPFADFKDRLLVLGGIDIGVAEEANVGPGGPHQKGLGGLFTGRELQTGTMADGDGSLAGWANGPSVDQEVVQRLSPPTLLPSLELGVRASASDVMGRISYSGPGSPVPPMNDPREVFQRLNSGFTRDLAGPEQAAAREQRRLVMTAVQSQYATLRPRVSLRDREKLERHADFLNGIVRRLDYGIRPGPACVQPGEPRKLGVEDAADMPDIAKLQMDLLALALACDLTRVASVQFSTAINAISFPWLNSTAEGHNLSHRGPSDTAARDQLIARSTWYAEQIAYLVRQLAAVTEGDRTLLDNTVLVWGNELSVGSTHSHKNMPFLTIGSAGGYFRTGRYVTFGGVPNNRLLVSLLNAMGVEANTFGHPDFGKAGPLPGLT